MNFELKDIVQDCHLNFLLGSGLSCPYLAMLGPIEALLTALDELPVPEEEKRVAQCSLYRKYFEGVISKNCGVLDGDPKSEVVLAAYCEFIKTLNLILLRRRSTILGKEVNLFTTNIDVFLEKAIERVGLECNDGFSGRFEREFRGSNFRKSHFRRSLQYDNLSELPTANLLKLHGSLTWQVAGGSQIMFSSDLSHVRKIAKVVLDPALIFPVDDGTTIDSLIAGCLGKRPDTGVDRFLVDYEELPIINPTKAKFRDTVLNQTHYDLLRTYSNELEKENSVLFVVGFSFADQHIRELTVRAANSNPTLLIRVYAYDSRSAEQINARFPAASIRNSNVEVIGPALRDGGTELFRYDLSTFNAKVLRPILAAAREGDAALTAS